MKKQGMPCHRYRRYPPVALTRRRWPSRTIVEAPRWCSVDLRDGNQALPTPMSVEEKLEMFEMLVGIGFKEIEVAFPCASQVEFDFVRMLIDEERIPDDVTIQVLTQAREHLIRRTFESLKGARRAVVHLYNSTSTVQRNVVFKKDKAGIIGIAVEAAALMRRLRQEMQGSRITFEYTPESFTGTELDYALTICEAVMDIWKPAPQDPMIVNLPATVEMSTPNIYADRIEWFLKHIKNRGSVIVSVHTHNDRGCAVAAAELAVMAGAQRVEGALFGNGERTGNMDILTMAMNLFSQGIDPRLDFSEIDPIRETYSRCTKVAVHPRHPYAGDLVYTAFSGSHQDAISKGLKAQGLSKEKPWDVPYLPIDPRDVGRNYESVIRINSQSGKGGAAFLMEKDWGFCIPKKMQPDFGGVIQAKSESEGRELSSGEVRDAFEHAYLSHEGVYRLGSCVVHSYDNGAKETSVETLIRMRDKEIAVKGKGSGPVDAFIRGLNDTLKEALEVMMYEEHALSSGADAHAVAYIGLASDDGKEAFGAGVDANISIASIKAVLSALNRT